MDTTAGTLIRDALTELTVQAQEQTVPAVDLNTGIRYLNRMMASLSAKGVELGFTEIESPNDEITIPAGAIEPVMFLLAFRLANGFDVGVTPTFVEVVNEGKATLAYLSTNLTDYKQSYPSTLPMGSGNKDNLFTRDNFFPNCCEDVNPCGDTNGNGDNNGV